MGWPKNSSVMFIDSPQSGMRCFLVASQRIRNAERRIWMISMPYTCQATPGEPCLEYRTVSLQDDLPREQHL